MSGPIVRKYGFPNHDRIFGNRELTHGTDEPAASEPSASATPAPKPAKKEKTDRNKKKKD